MYVLTRRLRAPGCAFLRQRKNVRTSSNKEVVNPAGLTRHPSLSSPNGLLRGLDWIGKTPPSYRVARLYLLDVNQPFPPNSSLINLLFHSPIRYRYNLIRCEWMYHCGLCINGPTWLHNSRYNNVNRWRHRKRFTDWKCARVLGL